MNNADKFKQIFDLYATELWAMSEKDFLAWLNTERDVPDTNVGDLISRQATMKMLNDNELARQADDVFDGDLHRYKRAAQRIIAQLPTIEPKKVVEDYCRPRNLMVAAAEDLHQLEKPNHGEWIKDVDAFSLYKCTACNSLCTVAGWANCIPEEQMYKAFKYCPNCGAKMERSED